MICPNCHKGEIIAAFHPVSIRCPICNGTGELPENIQYDPERGKNMKERRMWLGLTLRQFCISNGADAQTRSEEERGFFKITHEDSASEAQ